MDSAKIKVLALFHFKHRVESIKMKFPIGTKYKASDDFEYEIIGYEFIRMSGLPGEGLYSVRWVKFNGKTQEGGQSAKILNRNIKSGRWTLMRDNRCKICLNKYNQ